MLSISEFQMASVKIKDKWTNISTKQTEALVASRKICLEVNAEKTVYIQAA